jgi:hypothetical protein
MMPKQAVSVIVFAIKQATSNYSETIDVSTNTGLFLHKIIELMTAFSFKDPENIQQQELGVDKMPDDDIVEDYIACGQCGGDEFIIDERDVVNIENKTATCVNCKKVYKVKFLKN